MVKKLWIFLLLCSCASTGHAAMERSERNQLPPLPFQDDFDERMPWLRDNTLYVEIKVKDVDGNPVPHALVLSDVRPLFQKGSYPALESGTLSKVMRLNPGAWSYVAPNLAMPVPYARYIGRANEGGRLVDKVRKEYWKPRYNARPEKLWIDYVAKAPGYEVADKEIEIAWGTHNVVVEITMQSEILIDKKLQVLQDRLEKLKYVTDSVLAALGEERGHPDRKLLDEEYKVHTVSATAQEIDSFFDQYEYINAYRRYLLEQLDNLANEASAGGVYDVYCSASLWKSFLPSMHGRKWANDSEVKLVDVNKGRLDIVLGEDSMALLEQLRSLVTECPEEQFPQVLLIQLDLMHSDRRSLTKDEMVDWLGTIEALEERHGEVNWPVLKFWMQDYYLRIKNYTKAKKNYRWILENAPNMYTKNYRLAAEYELKSFRERTAAP